MKLAHTRYGEALLLSAGTLLATSIGTHRGRDPVWVAAWALALLLGIVLKWPELLGFYQRNK